jgi:hypothetical protein
MESNPMDDWQFRKLSLIGMLRCESHVVHSTPKEANRSTRIAAFLVARLDLSQRAQVKLFFPCGAMQYID